MTLILPQMGFEQLAPARITNGLVGWWRFLEGTGTTASDSSPSGIAGTLRSNNAWVTGVPGLPGKAISFDGSTNSGIDLGSDSGVAVAAPLSICAWVNVAGYGGNNLGRIFDPCNGAANNAGLAVSNSNPYSLMWLANNNVTAASSTNAYNFGSWAHVGAILIGTTVTYYSNGVSWGTASSPTITPGVQSPCIGNRSSDHARGFQRESARCSILQPGAKRRRNSGHSQQIGVKNAICAD